MDPLTPTPRTVDLEITSRCNARCGYCYYLHNDGVVYQDLPARRWLDFCDELGQAAVLSVCLSGGEPFFRPDFFKILEGLLRNRMRYQILTNGLLLTPEIVRRLSEYGHLDSIQVSIDGSSAAVHEILRGSGTFSGAIRAVRLLRESGLPVTVRTTIHAGNIEDLPALARLLLEEIGLPKFSTNAVSSLGTKSKYGSHAFLTPRLRFRAMRILETLDAAYPGRIEASAGPLAEIRMFREMEDARQTGKLLSGRGRLLGCLCIFSRLAVRADGAYIPCVMLPQIVLGRIGEDRLEEVWRAAPELIRLRGRRNLVLRNFPECEDCPYSELCTGNCAGTALSLTGEANRPSPEGCFRRFLEDISPEGIDP